MLRISLLIVLVFSSMVSYGQKIFVTFSGTGAASEIDSVSATNLTTNQSVALPGNATLLLSVNTGITEVTGLTDQGIVFPNPFLGRATFTTMVQEPQTVLLKLQNLVGQVVAQTTAFVQPGENEFSLSVAGAGIYMVSLTSGRGTSCYKIICTETNTPVSSIQYLGSGSGNPNNLSQSSLKSSLSGYSLGFTLGDIILYRCKSGVFTTILTDSPEFSKNYEVEFAACTDPDGNNYSIVKIGEQTWMAENLAYLPSVGPSTAGSNNLAQYYVLGYEGTNTNDAKISPNYGIYGALYNWEAAKAVCPTDWHLPTDEEWKVFEKNQGMNDSDADANAWRNSGLFGGKVKETGTAHWTSPNTGAINSTGFTALPGGFRNDAGGFLDKGISSTFWSASADGTTYAWRRTLHYNNDGAGRYNYARSGGFSVRCIAGNAIFLATVTTADITGISENAASGGGNVISDGGIPVTARGVCWNSTGSPTISDNTTTDGEGTGAYTSSLAGLTAGTPYFLRAYATNSTGTAYGKQVRFITPGGSGNGTFIDSRDNHVYQYVTIGTQTWMAENLAYLPSVSPSSDGSETMPYYHVNEYQGNIVIDAKATANFTSYGVLYNWVAAKTACPSGWHLPTDEEWKILEKNQGMSDSIAGTTTWRNSGMVGGKLKETGMVHWASPNTGASNESGFTALPGGWRHSNGSFGRLSTYAHLWSASANNTSTAWYRGLGSANDGVYRANGSKSFGYSVRCIIGQATDLAAVTTAEITDITETSAFAGGNVTNDGGTDVTARGVCWNTTGTPTITSSTSMDGTGTGAFNSSLTGLTAGTLYYVRAYATNSVGTAYGEQKEFTTDDGIEDSTFIDSRDSHVYKYVTIGTQTWMAENLAYLPSVSPSSSGSDTLAYYYVHGYEGTTVNDAKTIPNFTTYGVLYNWEAAKIACPTGWLLPTDEEWKVFEKYLGMSDSEVNTNNWRVTGAVGGKMKEAGTAHWAGANTGANNSTRFTALPGGYRSVFGSFIDIGYSGTFWSATEDNATNAWRRTLHNDSDGAGRYNYYKSGGFSVRCIAGQTAVLATVTTATITGIAATTASGGGNVTSDGGAPVTARGVCWTTIGTPTISNSTTVDGTGTGAFTSTLTGLTQGTQYIVRAYATNSTGTAYGELRRFTTIKGVSLATVTTTDITGITETSASGGGNVTADGGAQVTARGVCWNTTGAPSVSDKKTTDRSGTGSFTSSLTGLTAGTPYFVRAYATNSAGTAYGEQKEFSTYAVGAGTFTDIRDGNDYKYVTIGTQIWMAENLAYLPSVNPSAEGSETSPYFYVCEYNGIIVNDAKATPNYTTYGALYNWNAAMNGAASSNLVPSGVQGICPAGWHLPGDAELTLLTDYLINNGYGYEGSGIDIAKSMASTSGWASSSIAGTIGNDQGTNNGSGFNALPGGYRTMTGNFTTGFGSTQFWSASAVAEPYATGRYLSHDMTEMKRYNENKSYGFYVRCLKN